MYCKSLILFTTSIIIIGCSGLKEREFDVFLIGGQSNAAGQGYMKNIPRDFVIDTTVLIYYSDKCMGFEPFTWQPLCQASRTPDKFGVELSMGTRLQKYFPERKIALIKHAWSGSNLYHDWNPGKNPDDSASFGPEFKRFVRTVETGFEELRKKGYKPTIRAMVWQQGEGDALQRAGRQEVREAQKNIDQDSGHELSARGAFVVETDDLPLRCDEPDTPLPDDKVHFNTLRIIELGNRFADKIWLNINP